MSKSYLEKLKLLVIGLCCLFTLSGCASENEISVDDDKTSHNDITNEAYSDTDDSYSNSYDTSNDGSDESNQAYDSSVIQGRLDELMASNEDAFAWITVDGTSIDGPVLQSWEEDDYYASHNEQKQSDSNGAMYIEMANMANMCDFNTVIHGSGGENGVFAELINFANPDFFDAHEEFVIYLPDNKLTYEIWAVFERDNTSLIREYDFTYQEGCRQFLDDVYGDKVMGKRIRGGWGDANENMFMVTLTIDNPDSDKQLVVIGALIEDEQGTIDRIISE